MRVATWIRVSDEKQKEKWGIPRQQLMINECIAGKHTVVKPFIVTDVSGRDVMKTPEMKEMIRMMRSGEIQGIVAAAIDRIARPDDFSANEVWKICYHTGTLVITAARTYDPRIPIDALELGLMSSIAGFDKNKIRENTLGSHYAARAAMRHWGGRMPTGIKFDKETGVWSTTDDVQRIVDVMNAILDGNTNMKKHADYLHCSIPGVYWKLRNEIYTGWLVYAHKEEKVNTEDGKQKTKRVQLPKEEVKRYKVMKPVIEPAKFRAVQRILEEKQRARRQNTQRGRLLYSGFTFCARCGKPMTTKTTIQYKGKVVVYYSCSARMKSKTNCDQPLVRKEVFEAHLDQLLHERLVDPTRLARLAMKMENDARRSRSEGRATRLEADLAKLEVRRSKIEESFEANCISMEKFKAKLAVVDEEMQRVAADLASAHETVLPAPKHSDLVNMMRPFLRWPRLNREQRRQILATTFPRIIIDAGLVVSLFSLLENKETRINSGDTSHCHSERSCPPSFNKAMDDSGLRGIWIRARDVA